MNKIILLTILFCGMTMLFAQDQEEIAIPRPLNNIGLNLFGDASIISINYERQFEVKQNFLLSSKLGYGYNEEFQLCIFGPCQPPETYRTIPHHITGNFGKGKHLFEVGLGGTFIMGNTTQPYLLYPIVGYRLLPLKSGRGSFRIFGQIPVSGLYTDDIIFAPIGLNIGLSF